MEKKNYTDVILVRLGEITLKGQNRYKFEQRLISNISRRLKDIGPFSLVQRQSRIWAEPKSAGLDLELAMQRIATVFGVVSVSPARSFSGDLAELARQVIDLAGSGLEEGQVASFKIESRRSDKKFALTSPELSRRLGGAVLDAFPDRLKVDVHQPDLTIYVEVREQFYIYRRIITGRGGLPVGTGGRGLLLLSGGIDSPVAGYMLASRGMEIDAVYFHTFPYTSDQAKEKVLELARILTVYTGRMRVHVVDFTDIQLALRDHCPPDMLTISTRRMMMRLAEKIALENKQKALITGESLGQVASQTLEALLTTDIVVDLPVFRPLIGLDKQVVIDLARQIGTYETSILPYEDCCTVFVAKHPKTHPSLADASRAEEGLAFEQMLDQAMTRIEVVEL